MPDSTPFNPLEGGGFAILGGAWSTATVDESQFSQRGARAGQPQPADSEPQLIPEAFGPQVAPITSAIVRGGPPGRTGAQVAIRADGGEWQGRDEPWALSALTAFPVPDAATAATCTDPETGTVYIVISDTATGGSLYSWDVHTGAVELVIEDISLIAVGTAVWFRAGRVYVMNVSGEVLSHDVATGVTAIYSDADPSLYGFAITNYTIGDTRAAYNPDTGEVLVLSWSRTVGTITQLSSSDEGATWEVQNWATDANDMEIGTGIALAPITGGGFVVCYPLETGANPLAARRLGSAHTPLADASISLIPLNAAAEQLHGVVDEAGTIWVIGSYYSALSSAPIITAYSQDGGLSWSLAPSYLDRRDGGSFVPYAVAAGRGCLGMLCRPETAAVIRDEWWTARLGGWSELTLQTRRRNGVDTNLGSPAGWGRDLDASYGGILWTPHTAPETMSTVTLTQTGGSHTLETDRPGMSVATASGETRYWETQLDKGEVTLLIQLKQDGAGVVNLPRCGAAIHAENISGTLAYSLGINVYNSSAGVTFTGFIGPDITWSGNADQPLWILVAVSKSGGAMSAYIRQKLDAPWERVVNDGLLASGATLLGYSLVTWGHISSTGSGMDSEWRMVGAAQTRLDGWGLPSVTSPYSNSDVRRFGAPIAKRFIPAMGTGAGLTARAGLGRVGLETVHPVAYEYALTNATTIATRSSRWRSSDKGEQILEFSLEHETEIWGQLVIAFIGCNFRTAAAEYWDGSDWQALGSLDLGEPAGKWHRTGNMFRSEMNSGTFTGGILAAQRVVNQNELAGGYFTSNSTGAHRILRNTAGRWDAPDFQGLFAPDTTGYKPNGVRLFCTPEADYSSDPTEGDESALVHTDGVLIIPAPPVAIETSKIRITIEASQPTPFSYYSAAAIKIGQVYAFGASPDWSRQTVVKQAQQVARNKRGHIHAVAKEGPARRVWQLGWNDGAYLGHFRAGDQYIGDAHNGHQIGMRGDVFGLLAGTLEQDSETPVVMLSQIPTIDEPTTIIDPSAWLYCWLHPEADLDATQYAGSELRNEAIRIASITCPEVD